jgi:peptidoglycan/LPS O-acetylase OafA/YrhL
MAGDATAASRGYLPQLDGVRAVSIALVLLFHYPWKGSSPSQMPFRGGFLGVDIFFVISGFLITSLLLREATSRGRVSLRAFYARRALRLLPALGVLLLVAAATTAGLVDAGIEPTWQGIAGIASYMANWVQIWRPGSVGGTFGLTWSLGIEEQFYICFPILVIVLLGRRARVRTLVTACVAVAVASALWRVHLASIPPRPASFVDYYRRITARPVPTTGGDFGARWDRWYFGTDARLDALLVGAAAAAMVFAWRSRWTAVQRAVLGALPFATITGIAVIVFEAQIGRLWIPRWGMAVFELLVVVTIVALVEGPAIVPVRPTGATAVVAAGLVGVGMAVVLTRDAWPAPWLPVIVAVALIQLALVCAVRCPTPHGWFLGQRPLAWLGRRSYAVYLFHTVVMYVLTPERVHLHGAWHFLAVIATVLIVAEVSWRLVERPAMRVKQRFQRADLPARVVTVPAVPVHAGAGPASTRLR